MNWYCMGLGEMPVQTEEFLSVTKSIVRCSSIRNYNRFHSPTVTYRESNPNRENDLPTEAVAEAKSSHLRICPVHGLLAGVYQGDCSATNAVDQASGLSRECSVLHSKGISVHPSSQSLKHHVGSPDLLPEDPKLNSSCGPGLIRTTSGFLLFLMIWALYNLLPSDPIDTLSFSL